MFDEVLLAAVVSDGYSRNFTLPEKIGVVDYSVIILNESVIIVTSDSFESSKVIFTTTGQPVKGVNTIRKHDGEISLN